jgi:hypothetical protein
LWFIGCCVIARVTLPDSETGTWYLEVWCFYDRILDTGDGTGPLTCQAVRKSLSDDEKLETQVMQWQSNLRNVQTSYIANELRVWRKLIGFYSLLFALF